MENKPNVPICPIVFFDDNNIDNHPGERVECIIPGKPFAKQRPKAAKIGNHMTVYTPKQTLEFENLVKYSYYQQNGSKMLDGPLKAEVTGTFPVPSSASKKIAKLMLDGNLFHTKKPDCDNMAKAVLDALNDIAYKDDSQIVELVVVKRFGENPNTKIVLTELKEDD